MQKVQYFPIMLYYTLDISYITLNCVDCQYL